LFPEWGGGEGEREVGSIQTETEGQKMGKNPDRVSLKKNNFIVPCNGLVGRPFFGWQASEDGDRNLLRPQNSAPHAFWYGALVWRALLHVWIDMLLGLRATPRAHPVGEISDRSLFSSQIIEGERIEKLTAP